MRIIAGSLGGRQFAEPHGHATHPMSEKARGALFNTLGDIDGLSFLDAFAGSGALAFEAASRGASKVLAIERDPSAYKVINQNINELDLGDKVKAVRANVSGWSANNPERQFDILLLDPPYDDLQLNLVQKLIDCHLAAGGLAVMSFPGKQPAPEFANTAITTQKDHGDIQLIFYRVV